MLVAWPYELEQVIVERPLRQPCNHESVLHNRWEKHVHVFRQATCTSSRYGVEQRCVESDLAQSSSKMIGNRKRKGSGIEGVTKRTNYGRGAVPILCREEAFRPRASCRPITTCILQSSHIQFLTLISIASCFLIYYLRPRRTHRVCMSM